MHTASLMMLLRQSLQIEFFMPDCIAGQRRFWSVFFQPTKFELFDELSFDACV